MLVYLVSAKLKSLYIDTTFRQPYRKLRQGMRVNDHMPQHTPPKDREEELSMLLLVLRWISHASP